MNCPCNINIDINIKNSSSKFKIKEYIWIVLALLAWLPSFILPMSMFLYTSIHTHISTYIYRNILYLHNILSDMSQYIVYIYDWIPLKSVLQEGKFSFI